MRVEGVAVTLLLFGTWMLNASLSNPGGPAPASQTVAFRPSGPDGFFATEDTTYADDTRTIVQYTATADGRDYPITGSAAILTPADTVSLTMLNAFTIQFTYKRGGDVVLMVQGVVSPDGRILTLSTEDNRSLVYVKQ